METININGKESTENEFSQLAYKKDTLSCCVGEGYGFDEFLSTVFDELNSGFPRQQPEPPTLRPMSELPEVNEWVNVLIQHNDDLFWGDGCICLNRIELRYLGQDCWKNKNYISEEKVKALGWLPKEVLPNPNEIKLPC